jgi:hypothetical protein
MSAAREFRREQYDHGGECVNCCALDVEKQRSRYVDEIMCDL